MFTTLILSLSLLLVGMTASGDTSDFGGPTPPDCEVIEGVIVCD